MNWCLVLVRILMNSLYLRTPSLALLLAKSRYRSIYLSIYESIYLYIYLSIWEYVLILCTWGLPAWHCCWPNPGRDLSICLSIFLSIYPNMSLTIYQSTWGPSACNCCWPNPGRDLSICLSFCLSMYLSIYSSIHSSIYIYHSSIHSSNWRNLSLELLLDKSKYNCLSSELTKIQLSN